MGHSLVIVALAMLAAGLVHAVDSNANEKATATTGFRYSRRASSHHQHVSASASNRVTATRLGQVLGANMQNTFFPYAFNPAFASGIASNGNAFECLFVRVMYQGDPVSRIATSCATNSTTLTSFSPITKSSVVFYPSGPQEALGTEDPRIVLLQDGTYLMFYTAVQAGSNGNAIARLSLATALDPLNPSSWNRLGPLFNDVNGFQFTKSGALLINDRGQPSYLIYGDCSIVDGLQVAVASPDFFNYTVLDNFLLMRVRPGMFDSSLIESGPPPVRLSDGNWLFIYNAAQPLAGAPNGLFYAPGWAILNGSNPLQVLHRAAEPLLMPSFSWETSGQTPYIVFIEGLRPNPNTQDMDSFIAYYGAADANVGAALIRYRVQFNDVVVEAPSRQ